MGIVLTIVCDGVHSKLYIYHNNNNENEHVRKLYGPLGMKQYRCCLSTKLNEL